KISNLPVPHELIAGAPCISPPKLSQPSQADPFHHLWCTALSKPRATTSIRFAPQDTAFGLLVIFPPRLSYPFQPLVFGNFRSEERRVGKVCVSHCARYQSHVNR